jgi:hypothetical protein
VKPSGTREREASAMGYMGTEVEAMKEVLYQT